MNGSTSQFTYRSRWFGLVFQVSDGRETVTCVKAVWGWLLYDCGIFEWASTRIEALRLAENYLRLAGSLRRLSRTYDEIAEAAGQVAA